ncbi:hypothetical protein D3C81_1961390 [compost metagenome]
MKRLINGVIYVLLIGALILGGLVWWSLLTLGLWYVTVVSALLLAWAFTLGFLSEGGGSDREDSAD